MTWGKIYYVSSKALHNKSMYVICVYIDRLDIFCKYLQIFDLLVLNTKLFLEFSLPTFVISQILFILYKRCKWYKKGGLTTRGHSLTMLTILGRQMVQQGFVLLGLEFHKKSFCRETALHDDSIICSKFAQNPCFSKIWVKSSY